ncbi:hypothetical protein FCM35_KLT17925 [Carex littledalei]|uniref:Uncharacterized protein n=1 Tax=Carex littledalei TaxID=544730 RepID=A0A833RCR1_9POAL|nr:hypothetical protein FCM35_KLT17925 [Carex littledalei]
MESNLSNEYSELVQAQAELWNLTIGFLKSMSLRCALDLGIADAINNHGEPMTLGQLQSTLSLPATKKPHLHRLLRMLTHVGFLLEQGASVGTEAVYGLSTMSRLVLKNEGAFSMFSLVCWQLDFLMVKPSLHLGDWFKQDDQQKPFEMAHDTTFWEMMSKNPKFNKMFNDAMEGTNIIFTVAFVNHVSDVFKGVHSIVDVGGGTGLLAKGIAENFPHIECTVLDLPHVIRDIPNDGPVKFVSGDMFNYIPPAHVVVLKWILHDWCDEDCIKILRRCKEAIASSDAGGKVIVIENVIGSTSSKTCQEAHLLSDLLMLTIVNGAERDELQWKKLFTDAGFASYQITQKEQPVIKQASMESNLSNEYSELVQAQAELWNLTIGFLKSMSLRCALDLGIADAINNHGQPMTLGQLQSTLSLPATKKPHLHRLLRMLTHVGFLLEQGASVGTEAVYGLSTMSRLVLKSEGAFSMFSLVCSHLDFIMVKPSLHLGDWFKQDDQQKPFEMAHNSSLWEMMSKNPKFNKMFNDAMEETNIVFTIAFVNHVSDVFKGVHSIVDVGGGTGALAKGITENFPHVECTVLDLPHVIRDIPNDGPVKFVSGDMFNYIPPAHAVVLKWILHDWCDEDCIKILRRCKEAIASSDAGGKVIVIENVIGSTSSKTCQEAHLLSDLLMLTILNGAERDELQWKKLFTDAGFASYQITCTIGFISIIEIYP